MFDSAVLKPEVGKKGEATETLRFIRFFFFYVSKTKIQLGKPKTPANKEELNKPGNYLGYKVKTGSRASSI